MYFLVLGDFSMDLLGFCCVYFGFGCLLILVWINLVDFGRDGFGCWACGMDGFGCWDLGARRGEKDSLAVAD